MKKNINDYERVFRIVFGGFLSSLAFWGPKKTFFLSFLIPVVTGLSGKCPLYTSLKISSRKEEKELNDEYYPVQSDSERAAGHPIVGVV